MTVIPASPRASHRLPRVHVGTFESTPSAADSISTWLDQETARSHSRIERIHPSQSAEWRLDEQGCLAHKSGRFFRVVGVEFQDADGGDLQTHPIIDQPEIGTLCFLTSQHEHTWWLLAQAKVEPGNVNGAQLAPTVQATESNYRSVHGGKSVPYLHLAHGGEPVLYDQLQSEQNSRFLRKRNRNKVVQIDRTVPEANASFRWLPVADVLPLLQQSNRVNTDARSVIACWLIANPQILQQCRPAADSFGGRLLGSLRATSSQHTIAQLNEWLDDLNRRSCQRPREVALSSLRPHWQWHGGTFESTRRHVLQVRHISVECATREVTRWDQPILATRTPGRLTTLTGMIGGVQHLLLQARWEAGNREGFEITTTIQADSADDMTELERRYADTFDATCTRLLRFENSEEGGRFDHCISQYELYWTDHPRRIGESLLHRWVSLAQLAHWMREPNRLTNELRSTLSAILSVND